MLTKEASNLVSTGKGRQGFPEVAPEISPQRIRRQRKPSGREESGRRVQAEGVANVKELMQETTEVSRAETPG